MTLRDIFSVYWRDWDHIFALEYAWIPILLLAVFCWRMTRVYPAIASLSLFWFGFSALRGFANTKCPFSWPEMMIVDYEFEAAASLVFLMFYFIAPLMLKIESWILVFKSIAVINAWWIIVGSFLHSPWGILLDPSMSGCFSATLLPLFFPVRHKASMIFWIPILVSVFFSRQSLPLATLSAILGIYLLRRRNWRTLIGTAVGIPLVGTAISSHEDHNLFNTHGRWLTWKDCLDWHWNHNNIWMGSGSGSFAVAGPITTGGTGNTWMWAHSEYIQVLIEQGIIGLVLLLGLYSAALYRARNRSSIFYGLIGFGAFAAANMPFRYPLSALFGAFLIHCSFKQNGLVLKEG